MRFEDLRVLFSQQSQMTFRTVAGWQKLLHVSALMICSLDSSRLAEILTGHWLSVPWWYAHQTKGIRSTTPKSVPWPYTHYTTVTIYPLYIGHIPTIQQSPYTHYTLAIYPLYNSHHIPTIHWPYTHYTTVTIYPLYTSHHGAYFWDSLHNHDMRAIQPS
jgi:hypothetical protein